MTSKIRLPVQALAVLLCATTASAQENRGTPEQGRRALLTPSVSVLATFPIPRELNPVCGRTCPISAMHADRYLNKA